MRFGLTRRIYGKLVIHHTYANGLAFDLSDNQNHVIAIAVTPGDGPLASTFGFQTGGSRINVLPSRSLMNPHLIRARILLHCPRAAAAPNDPDAGRSELWRFCEFRRLDARIYSGRLE